jgi:hypothetical protein
MSVQRTEFSVEIVNNQARPGGQFRRFIYLEDLVRLTMTVAGFFYML